MQKCSQTSHRKSHEQLAFNMSFMANVQVGVCFPIPPSICLFHPTSTNQPFPVIWVMFILSNCSLSGGLVMVSKSIYFPLQIRMPPPNGGGFVKNITFQEAEDDAINYKSNQRSSPAAELSYWCLPENLAPGVHHPCHGNTR